ncbi:MAG: hypothetical protein HDR16_08425 [Lachnospiraceae bacterium]|nr:hypothetical protein [Lachnospiraceae bacterium]
MKIYENYPDGKMLWFNDFYNDGDSIFFSAGNFNGLYKYSLKGNGLQRLGEFKDEFFLEKQLYGSAFRFENQLIFVPLSAYSIGIFNLENESFESVPLPVPKAEGGIECKFLNSVLYNNSIFAFPGYATYIIEYDINNKKIIVHDEWYGEFINRWEKRSNLLFHFDMVQINDMVYIPSAQYNGWFQYCLSKNTYMFMEVLSINERINTLCYDGKYLWSTTEKKVIILNLDGTIVDQIDICAVYGVKGSFYHSVFDNGYLWLFFSQSSEALKIACSHYKEKFEIVQYCALEKRYTNYEYHAIDFIKKKKDGYCFLCRGNRILYKIVGGDAVKWLDAIEDTTDYSEQAIADVNILMEAMRYQDRTDAFLHRRNNKNSLGIAGDNFLVERENNNAEDIGTKIFKEML